MNDSSNSIDTNKAKALSSNVFVGQKYRISIISDSLIRFEYSESGSFNDFPTLFANNRSFSTPKFKVEEVDSNLIISNDNFIIRYVKEKPFIGSKFSADQYLRVTSKSSGKNWYFNHPEVRNFKSTTYSLDDYDGKLNFENGLFSLDGFFSYDDSRTPLLDQNGNVLSPNYKNIDTYLFIYNNEFGVGLRDYFNLTSLPPLIPRYALGVWWNKNEAYNINQITNIVNNFKKHQIPFSVFLLSEFERTRNKRSTISFSLNKLGIPSHKELYDYLHKNNISVGCNIKTEGNITNEEENYNIFNKIYQNNSSEDIPVNVYDIKFMNAFLNGIIYPFMNNGLDFLWIDDKTNTNRLKNFVLNHYIYNYMSLNKEKRPLILSRNFGIAPHKYSILYSGRTFVNWKTLKLLPFFNSTAANIGISWWSHDIGGFKDGIEDSELYMRYVQLGVYSPILRLSSNFGKYYKREPWAWDAKTLKIVHDYLRMRHKLIPYLYSEAYRYSTLGIPLIQPLYYKYPQTYDEPLYKNEFYYGSQLFVAPIVDPKDNVMNRVVHRIFLPNGIWYDFKTGKKFPGGKRYITFYKDEDYPVYAKQGAIIPLKKTDNDNLNDTSCPKRLEIHVFPGRSNTFKLYEDDGVSQKYKQGESKITEINYYYKENDFSVEIKPLEGIDSFLPKERDYIIKFRNTKFTKEVNVLVDSKLVECEKYVDENDFVVEFNNVPINSSILVYCRGKDIEINAQGAIIDDIQSIISDLRVSTELKERLDKLLFSDKTIQEKRFGIIKMKGLSSIFKKMFLKLLEYAAEV